jgi:hypothetical protein
VVVVPDQAGHEGLQVGYHGRRGFVQENGRREPRLEVRPRHFGAGGALLVVLFILCGG